MKLIKYEEAEVDDCKAIASLHAQSWKENYRGIYSDYYLDNEVAEERYEHWQKIFENLSSDIFILKAFHNNKLIGFACTYSNYKGAGENYLDNLHVQKDYRGRKVGEELLKKSAKWAFSLKPRRVFYLLVYEQNDQAIRFYKRLGGEITGPSNHKNFDGSISPIMRCSWNKFPLA